MSEDQDPVQNQVQRHRKQRDDHDDPGAKRRNQQEAQHRRTEEPRNAPGNRPQKTADLRHQAGFVAEVGEQRRRHHQRRHHRRCQHRRDDQPATGDAPRGGVVAGADRMRGQWRYRRQQPLRGHQQCRIECVAEPGGGERYGAEMPDHHGVGHLHCHLRQVGSRQRRRDGKRRTDLRGDGRAIDSHDPRTSLSCSFQLAHRYRGPVHAIPYDMPLTHV